jgi:Ni/Fe-hydrogenase subunit HybB-like protein/Fe-S-cluster-containing dehydrogenase component
MGILYDPTLCVGCRECVLACAEAAGCEDPEAAGKPHAELGPGALTVLERRVAGDADTFVKVQCMHCVDPACVSACMLGAMRLNQDGSVTWNADLCVGCRYCQIACPFNVPRFEWDTPTPRLRKCELCPERRARGLAPACVERCRRGALLYGPRDEMLAEAHRRVRSHPDRYGPRVYGEREGGGTSVLYLTKAGVSFADMGLPELGEEPVPSLTESIQHTLYRGFAAPLALLAGLGAIVRRNARHLPEIGSGRDAVETPEPVGGRIVTWSFLVLATFALVGALTVAWRFVAGLGATTNLNDGYPMGLWIAFDVVTGTALACGGYAVAILVYLANRGRYHPLVRAAVVTSALGYTLGGLSVLIDIGRPWNAYKIPLLFPEWNVHSILLEVALCIMLYTAVLWIEVSPAFLERWKDSPLRGLRRFAAAASPRLERALPYVLALGLLLPTMHQSSLGSLMLIAGQKLHPLWHSPLLPLLFLVSCVAMGYAAVTLECCISARVFHRPAETAMLRGLAVPVAGILLAYAAIRGTEVVLQGELGLVTRWDGYSALFLAEMALFVIPALALWARRRGAGPGYLSAMAVTVILGGALYRFSTYLIAFDPGNRWSYFPALPEFAVTIGIVATEVLAYGYLVKRFPILRGRAAADLDPEADDAGASQRYSQMAAAAAIALLFAAVGASPLGAQQRAGGADLRCLTAREVDCLEEPVPADEPHDARCSTCHDLWEHDDPEAARGVCTEAGCHDRPATFSAFHETLGATVLHECAGCHRSHDARIPGGAGNCEACHASGGARPAFAGSSARTAFPVAAPGGAVTFRHATHSGVDCTACHGVGGEHGSSRPTTLEGCRACHHQPPVSSRCLACHAEEDARAVTRDVQRVLDITLGSLDRPTRVLPFDHDRHEETACETCHTEGSGLTAAGVDCGACHADHHGPEARCASCHDRPAADAHDIEAHLGCGGSGCHADAAATVKAAPRTRQLCLACHRDYEYHEPARDCATCHRLPPPRSAAGR